MKGLFETLKKIFRRNNGSNALELSDIDRNAELFPIYGVTLGKTTVAELARMGTTGPIDDDTGKPYKCYKVKELDFWNNENGIADDLHMTYTDKFPDQWRKLGFNWRLSYNNWIKLFEHLGFHIEIIEPPHIGKYQGRDSFFAKIMATRQKGMVLEVEFGFRYQKGTTADSPSTLYCIDFHCPGFLPQGSSDPDVGSTGISSQEHIDISDDMSGEDTHDDGSDLFPLYGVTLGKTTLEELTRIGLHSKVKKDNGEPYTYFIVRGMNFWYDENGVADHMYITRTDPLPAQWRKLGFDWSLSYDDWMSLLADMDFLVEVADPPHEVQFEGQRSLKAKLIATRQTNMLLKITLGFGYGSATTTDLPGTLYSMNIKCIGFLSPAPKGSIPEPKLKQGEMEGYENGNELFPLYGVSLGETTVQQLSQLGVRSTSKQDNGEPFRYYVVQGMNFWFHEDDIVDHIYITHTNLLPQKWRDLGFDWEHSYDEWISLLEHLDYRIDIIEPPHVKDYQGHDSFYAKIVATGHTRIPLEIELSFRFSNGISSDSMGTLYCMTIRVVK